MPLHNCVSTARHISTHKSIFVYVDGWTRSVWAKNIHLNKMAVGTSSSWNWKIQNKTKEIFLSVKSKLLTKILKIVTMWLLYCCYVLRIFWFDSSSLLLIIIFCLWIFLFCLADGVILMQCENCVFYITKTCSIVIVGWRNVCALGGLTVAKTFFLRTVTPGLHSVLFEVRIIRTFSGDNIGVAWTGSVRWTVSLNTSPPLWFITRLNTLTFLWPLK